MPDPLDGVSDTEISGDAIDAPMPGLVKCLSAQAGQNVAKGEALIVLEAMKMEHTLTAPRDGQVAEVFVMEGEQVGGGVLLLTLDPEDADG